MITSALLENYNFVRHGFFTRQGGHSTNEFSSLNCGYGSGDDGEVIRSNRASAMHQINFDERDLVTAYQTHSAKVETVIERWNHKDAPHVDAMVTNLPSIALGILTADCAPVLFADTENHVIGAAHAGWRGAKSGILKETVKAMVKLGAKPNSIVASIGPCIRQESYEVSDAFRSSFLEEGQENEMLFIPSSRQNHFQFDLPGYLEIQLKELSVSEIDVLPFDTYSNEDTFYSYRRATHQNEECYGRSLSAIGLKKNFNST